MSEPAIRYVRTSDGVNIAFAVSGAGPVLVSVPAPPDNHVELEYRDPERRVNIDSVSRQRTVVRFDGRGSGLSDRGISEYSLASRLKDLEAVVERIGAASFALISGGHGNQVTFAYAAQHPERVTHVIAVNPFVHGRDFMAPDQLMLWRHMLHTNFRMFTENVGALTFGWGTDEGPRYSEYMRQCVDPADAKVIYDAMVEVDIRDVLPRVKCPVLLMRSDGGSFASASTAREVAALLPNASLVTVEGLAVEGATPEMRRKIGDFLGEDWSEPGLVQRPRSRPGGGGSGGLRTILFTDLEGHTAMMSRLGDAAGRAVLREHERVTRDALAAHGGTEVKSLGDGFMASFPSAQRALESAVAMQRAFSTERTAVDAGLRVRIGVNAGEPIEEDDDLFGAAVITTARIAALAEGGQILMSDVVRQLVAGKGFLVSDRGEHALKGMEEPVRLWELRWAG